MPSITCLQSNLCCPCWLPQSVFIVIAISLGAISVGTISLGTEPAYGDDSSPKINQSSSSAITSDTETSLRSPNTPSANTSSDDLKVTDEIAVPLAGHSEHGEAYNEGPRQNAYIMGGTGKVDFKITCNGKEPQAFFDQGLGQLYGFWYYEAERSFRRVAALDPECAMAYWGMAKANEENKDRAKSFLAEAMDRLDNVTERERMHIESLQTYLTDKRDEKEARQKYIKGLEKIIRKYPDDIETKAILSVHLWQSDRHGVPITSHQAVDSLLGDVFRIQPMHPAHHFRIHLWDHEEPSQALASAARCGQAAPAIAHMWHMPGHIYSRLHRYRDAVFQQEASARVDHAHMMHDEVLPDQIHNFAHNNEWLIRNLVHLGRRDEALALAKNMLELPRHPKYNAFEREDMCSCKYGRLRLLEALESFEMWDDIVTLSNTMYLEPTDQKKEQGDRLRHLALAHYHRGEWNDVQTCLEQLQALAEEFDVAAAKAADEAAEKKKAAFDAEDQKATQDDSNVEKAANADKESTDACKADKENADSKRKDSTSEQKDAGDPSKADPVAVKPESADEKIARRKKEIEEARNEAEKQASQGKKSVEHAIAEIQAIQLLARGETDQAIERLKDSDMHECRMAQYYFLAGDHGEATKLCEKSVEDGENQVRPLAVQVDLLRRMGRTDDARKAFERLRVVAGTADLQAPIFTRLEKIAEDYGWPTDWRLPAETPNDVGDRPLLDSLGPFRWGPSPAKSWRLTDQRGDEVSLADFEGRPVVVIFYLGAGCLHCVEQLHSFAPMISEYRDAGIELVGISTETADELANAVKSFSKENTFPMRLAANSELDVFKAYRAYDDFEEMPLHGTFLIDGDGQVRWRDISFEPFLDARFVLNEAKRIFSTQAATAAAGP